MIALRRVDVAELNARARAWMRAAGKLGDQELAVGGHPSQPVTASSPSATTAGSGVTNGTLATITAVDLERRTITARTDKSEELALTSEYLKNGNLSHAYALTAHKAQGTGHRAQGTGHRAQGTGHRA